MRRINLRNKEDKKKKRNQIIVGVTLIFVMFSSILGFAFISFSGGHGGNGNTNPLANPNGGNSVNYNGFVFVNQNSLWILNKDNINFIFRYNPNEVPRISSEIKDLENYQNKILYLESEDILAESEIRTNLLQFTNKIEKFQGVENCEENTIIIREGSEGITQKNNCVFIEGNQEGLTQLADEFLFKLFEVEN